MLAQVGQQFAGFWKQQSKTSRAVFIVLVALGMVLVPLFLVWAQTPSYEVAFAGLSETDAGQIVTKLQDDGIKYKLQGTGTILVPSDQVYEVRISMAEGGLPESSTVGFEVFSGNTLGMTEFTQRINYQQALEGELERTIGSLSSVSAVRVHIVMPEDTLLASQKAPTTASVTIKEKAGTKLDSSQVSAITHLLASSVEGLNPENVVVVDINGNMYTSGESGNSTTLAQTDSRRAAEAAAANEVKNKVQTLLDSALGPNKSIVQANVTLDWTERQTVTQSVDPDKTAVLSSQSVVEVYTTTNGTVEGVPGATSNLPPAAAGVDSNSNGVKYARNETTNNYEVTKIESEEVFSPGAVNRISLSVLVDGITDEAQLTTLKSVIAAAAGIDEARGDTFAVESLAFDRSYYETQTQELESSSKQDLYFKIGEGVAAGLVVLALLWYVQRLLANLRLASTDAWMPVMKPVSELGLPTPGIRPQIQGGGLTSSAQLESSTNSKAGTPGEGEIRQKASAALKPLPKIELPSISPEYEQLQKTIEGIAEDDPASLAEAIQLWLNEDEKHNG
jgi:flagellar M-ring protein FliF